MAVGQDPYDHLADGLLRGSPQAVIRLVETFGARLYGYLGLMLGDRDVATHALADTMIVATGHIGRLSEVDHLPSWLFALARRERERQRRAVTSRAIPDALAALTTLTEGATAAERAYLAMARLDAREREILLLSTAQSGLADADVARVLGTEDATDLHRHAVLRYREEAMRLGFGSDIEPADLIGALPGALLGAAPSGRVLYMCIAPEMANRRPQVRERVGPFGADGFPLSGADRSGASGDGGRRRGLRPWRTRPRLAA
jgi:DNA-directed RNA polymerase specialized sigma24 family protein